MVDLYAGDLEGMATAIAMFNCISRVTRHLDAVEDEAAGILPDPTSIIVQSDR
jgi:hypothetical protein